MNPRISIELPWKRPDSIYDDDGPTESTEFDVNGIRFRVAPTRDYGCDTGRRRFRCECLTCNEELHPATTGPSPTIQDHLRCVHANNAADEGLLRASDPQKSWRGVHKECLEWMRRAIAAEELVESLRFRASTAMIAFDSLCNVVEELKTVLNQKEDEIARLETEKDRP